MSMHNLRREYTQDQWEAYATALEAYADDKPAGDKAHRYGTCCYCEKFNGAYAYMLFEALLTEELMVAQNLNQQYNLGHYGRTDFRVKAARQLAAYIRKEILHA